MKEESIKRIRKLPLRIFIVLVILIVASILQSADGVGTKTVIFKARVSRKLPTKTYQEVPLNKNYFVTGVDGEVYWKPISFYQAFVLENVVNGQAPFATLNILYLMIFAALLHWMVQDLRENNVFNLKISRGFRFVSVFAALWMVKDILQFYLSNYFIKEITNRQFEAIRINFSVLPYLLIIALFEILSYIIVKGRKVEQEQELTI